MKLSGILVAMAVSGAVLAAGPAPVISAANAQENPQQRLDRLERMLEARQQGQARILEQLGQLQREVSELRGITEDHAYQLDQILQRQRDLYQEIDRRVAEVQAMGAAQPTPTEPEVSVNYSDDTSENEAYDQAVRLVLEERDYERAIPAFRSFVETYPDSPYMSNARYWLGQLYFADGNYTNARTHFQEVVDNFPNSNKRADCILKLGMIAAAQGDSSQARERFNQVRSEYPDSTEAGLAARELENL